LLNNGYWEIEVVFDKGEDKIYSINVSMIFWDRQE
jgi:hypothetical protein